MPCMADCFSANPMQPRNLLYCSTRPLVELQSTRHYIIGRQGRRSITDPRVRCIAEAQKQSRVSHLGWGRLKSCENAESGRLGFIKGTCTG